MNGCSREGRATRLLAVGSGCEVRMLEVDAERGTALSVRLIGECPAQCLLQEQHAYSGWSRLLTKKLSSTEDCSSD